MTQTEPQSWRSYRITKFGEPLELQCECVPTVAGTEVLVKVACCGVCHSDVHIADGYFDLGGGRKTHIGRGEKGLPFTPGHEIVGEVVAFGSDVSDLKVGERRVVFPWIGCEKADCRLCNTGEEHMCGGRAVGVMKHGGFSNFVVVPHPRYLVGFEGIPEQIAATYACSGLTAYASLKKVGRLSAADHLVIVGAGGVGLSAISLAKEVTGVAPIVVEIDPSKADGARAAGAIFVIDPTAPDAARDFVKQYGGAAVVVDFVGSEASAKFAAAALRKMGRLLIVGLFGGTFQIPVSFFPLLGLTISGTQVGSLAELKELIALGQNGKFAAIPVETRPLDAATEVLTQLKLRQIYGRVVLRA